MPKKSPDEKGFTLIELIMVIILISTLGMFCFGYVLSYLQVNVDSSSQKEIVDEAKIAMELMTREIRQATATTVVEVINTSITFDRAATYGEDTDLIGIVYSYNGASDILERQSNAVTTTIANNLTSFSLTEPQINFYLISMTFTHPTLGGTFKLTSAVTPRDAT